MAISGNLIRISSGAALCALLAVPVACSSDTNGGSNDGGTPESGAGGSQNTGGKSSTGGSGGSKATGGSTSMGGGGMTSTGGKGGGGTTGTGGKTTSPEAGPDSSTGIPDSGTPDASDGATHQPPACPPPTTASKGRLCLTFDPEMVTAIPQDPRLDNKGTLIVLAFDPASATPTVPIAQKVISPPVPPNEDAGTPLDISELPEVDLDDMPTTVVINAYFVDNPEFFAPPISQKGFTYGMYVGGYDLAAGIFPKPTPKPITLTAGEGLAKSMSLTALRRFTSTIKYSLVQNMNLAGDGQGPLSVGVFNVSAAKNQPVRGGAQLGCKDITKGDIPVTGFFYGGSGTDVWAIAELNEFNVTGLGQPGDPISLGGGQDGQSAPDSAKLTISDAYSYNIPALTLNIVLPLPGAKPAEFSCP